MKVKVSAKKIPPKYVEALVSMIQENHFDAYQELRRHPQQIFAELVCSYTHWLNDSESVTVHFTQREISFSVCTCNHFMVAQVAYSWRQCASPEYLRNQIASASWKVVGQV